MSEESSTPLPIDSSPAEAMRQASSPRRYLGDVIRVESVTSTNELLVLRARDGARAGTVLVADSQSAGRGRRARRWVAPPGGALLCSVLFRPPLPAEELHHVSSIVALAARGAAFATTGAEIGLKWPNDVVSIDGKLAGVLAEVVESAPAAVVVGIGFNLFFPPGWPSLEDAAEIGIQLAGATTLEAESGVVVSRDEFLEAFLDELDLMYARLIGSDGPAQIALRYRDACSTLGRVVRVETPTGELRGVAVDIRTDGALLIEVDGAVRAVTVADVVHLRPSERTT